MEINRDNYIMWIVSWYDGTLSDREREAFTAFLRLNPDLREEFNDFPALSLHPDISERVNRSSLYRSGEDLDNQQAETYAVAIAEGDIAGAEAAELEESLAVNHRCTSLVDEYRSIRLKPGDEIFPGKTGLKWIPYRRAARIAGSTIAAAATLALFITIGTLQTDNDAGTVTNISSSSLVYTLPTEKSLDPLLSELRPEIRSTATQPRVQSNSSITAEAPLRVERAEPINRVKPAEGILVRVAEPATAYALVPVTPAEYPLFPPAQDLSPRQFIAMNVRKLILKEEDVTPDRLRPHEVADASIESVNWLLGWNMHLETETGEDGRLESLRFTSQLINFDRDLKKSGDDQ